MVIIDKDKINCQQIYSKEMEMQIVKEYLDGASTKDLCKKYGFKTPKSITDKVRKYGEQVRSNQEEKDRAKSYREFTVEKLDNEFKAYYIGLMLSDGYVISGRNTVGIDMTDEDVIEFLSTTIGKTYKTLPNYKDGDHYLPRHRIILTDKRIYNEVARYGIVPNKSLILEGFDLTTEEYRFFPYIIRGLIDGDGWVRKDGSEFFISTGSQKFAEWIKFSLETRLYMTGVNLVPPWDDRAVWQVRTAGKRNLDILKLLVYDKPFGMSRKYNLLHGKPSETIMETPA